MCGLASGTEEQRWHRLQTAGMLRRMSERPADVIDNPIERLELLAGDDEAIASFLDQIEVTGPREREMLGELARTGTLADPERFPAAHRRAVAALETLGRHGYHGASAGGSMGRSGGLIRWLIQLVARFVVVSYLRPSCRLAASRCGARELAWAAARGGREDAA